MTYSRIVGTGSYLPPRVMTNDEFAARLDTSDAWIQERTGIRQRHIADKSQAASDLALEASRRALAAAGLTAERIDLIVVAQRERAECAIDRQDALQIGSRQIKRLDRPVGGDEAGAWR